MIACAADRKKKFKKALRYFSQPDPTKPKVKNYVKAVVDLTQRGKSPQASVPVFTADNDIKILVSSAEDRRSIRRRLKALHVDAKVIFQRMKAPNRVPGEVIPPLGADRAFEERQVARFAAERAEILKSMRTTPMTEDEVLAKENFLASLNADSI